RAGAWAFVAEHGVGAAIVQFLRGAWREGVGSLRDGAGAGNDGEPRDCQRANLERLPHAEPMHEALADLHGIPAGGSGARLVVDAHTNQRWSRSRHRLIDQALKVLFVGGPGAVGETAG